MCVVIRLVRHHEQHERGGATWRRQKMRGSGRPEIGGSARSADSSTPRLDALVDEAGWATADANIPRGSAGSASEIAGPVLFLMSDLATYLTGQTITVDGGLSGSFPGPF